MNAVKSGAVANSRLGMIFEKHDQHLKKRISVDRSGGGV